MKIIKKLSLLLVVFIVSGCLQTDTMENIDIHTTAFPIEYVVNRLYGERSTVRSIFPNGAIRGETLSDTLLNNFSRTDLFIFSGLDPIESDAVRQMSELKMRNENKQLRIIDVTLSLVYRNKLEELWLDPMNLLTIANNILSGFEEYITNTYLINEIRSNYEILRHDIIQLEADFSDTVRRANRNVIVVSDDMFLFLRRYNLEVISLEENSDLTTRTIHRVNELIESGNVVAIFTIQNQPVNNTIQEIHNRTNVALVPLHDLFKLTEEEASRNETYFSIMRNNLELLKTQLYN